MLDCTYLIYLLANINYTNTLEISKFSSGARIVVHARIVVPPLDLVTLIVVRTTIRGNTVLTYSLTYLPT